MTLLLSLTTTVDPSEKLQRNLCKMNFTACMWDGNVFNSLDWRLLWTLHTAKTDKNLGVKYLMNEISKAIRMNSNSNLCLTVKI